MAAADANNNGRDKKLKDMIERNRVGSSARHKSPELEENRPPITSSELSRGPAELAADRNPRVNWRVFIIAAAIILTFSVWAMLVPTEARSMMHSVVTWISTNLGWYYVLTITLVILFVLWVALSKEGSVRLGPDHSRPQYNLFTWVAMLFAAGVGIDMLFY